MPTARKVFLMLAIVWIGSLWTIGYVVAPALFATLDDAHVAGMIAGGLFRVEASIGLVAGVLLLVLGNLLIRRGAVEYRRLRHVLLAMILCILAGHVALEPLMSSLRDQALAMGMPVGASPMATRFGVLHAISSLFYLIESLLGAWLLWRLADAPPATRV